MQTYELLMCTPIDRDPRTAIAAAKAAVTRDPNAHPNIQAMAAIPDNSPLQPQHIAVVNAKYWGMGGLKLSVGFLDNPTTELRSRILSHMNAWGKTANVEFAETADAQGAEVRINRAPTNDPQWAGYWSFVGTDIKLYTGPYNQTMNLEGFTMNTPDSEFYRVVRHETGHTLGFPHEHMRKNLVAKIDRNKAIQYYGRLCGWSPQQVIDQVLTPISDADITGTEEDPLSIMCYQVPGQVTIDGQPIIGGLDIDQVDYDFAALIYPKPVES